MRTIDSKDKRQRGSQRILWVSDPATVFIPRRDRRVDTDVRRVCIDLFRSTQDNQIGGIVVATLNRSGSVDLIAAGDAYDYPVIAAGAAVKLKALLNAWFSDPSDWIED